jgi:putative flippase GtrA
MNDKKEFIRYIIWGIITSIFHVVFFWLLNKLGIIYQIANVIAIITTKALAYVVNKIFVYKTKCSNLLELLKEMFKFIISRGFTFFIDFFGLIILVDVLHIDKVIGKIIVLIVVVIINYILGKIFVYKKTRTD